jgi:hypothetical protein
MADTLIIPQRFTPPTLADNPRSRLAGRPNSSRETLLVPGQPHAIEHRPTHAPGRIPIASASPTLPTETEKALPFDADSIQRDVESSEEYQALKRMGYIKENPLRDEPHQPVADSYISTEITSHTENRAEKVEIEIHQEQRIEIQLQAGPISQEEPPRRSDPLALDLNGNGLETTGLSNGVHFDINADGLLDQTSFISGGDAFLALDANGNGLIDNGGELFGDQHGDDNGYLALARFDDNHDGVINRDDAIFQQLRLFTMNSEGTQQLHTLEESGIVSLSLSHRQSDIALNQYDTIAQLSSFERVDGSNGASGDLLLGYKTLG